MATASGEVESSGTVSSSDVDENEEVSTDLASESVLASETDTDEKQNCSVCENKCIGRRKFPECEHFCCETCIFIYILKLKDDDELDTGVPCPSCNVISLGPKDLKTAIEWIKSLERGSDVEPDVEVKKQGQKDICNSCRSSHATKICIDCCEALCQSCSVGRHTHRLLRNHNLVDILFYGDKSKRENRMFEMLCELLCCESHPGNPIAFYCEDHGEMGCESCVELDHKQCSLVVKANASGELESIEDEQEKVEASSEGICTYAKTMLDIMKANAETNRTQYELIKTTLKVLRKNVTELFDNLEDNTLKIAQNIIDIKQSEHDKATQVLEEMISTSTYSAGLIEKFMIHGSVTDQHIVVPKIKERMKTAEESLLEMSKTFKTSTVDFKQNESLLQLLNLGELFTLTEKEDNISIHPFQGRLLLKQNKVKKIKTLSTQNKHNKKSATYTYVKILHNHNIIVVDTHDNICIMIKPNGEVLQPRSLSIKQPGFSSKLFKSQSITTDILKCLDGKRRETVAVPCPSQNKVLFILADETREVNTMYQPKALHVLKHGDIAVAWDKPVAFGIISISTILGATKVYFQKDKSGRTLQNFEFIAVDERRSHVIQPCTSTNAVYCFDFEGNPVFEYKVSNPRGVALDGDSNVYICCYEEGLYILSPRGNHLRTIDAPYFPRYPLAIAFYEDGENFVATQKEYSSFVQASITGHDITVLKLVNA